jgi:predicted dehydrogenase
VVRVPSHHAPTKAALEAGKHVYCEWPLGQTTAEAEELLALAQSRGLATAVGLQARVHPALLHLKEQIDSGYVGEVLAVHVSQMRDGVLSRPANRTWQRDASLGANTLTIANGHTLDAMRFVLGELDQLSAVVTTQARQWLDTDAQTLVDVTSPDNVLISGRLKNGAVASLHVGAVPFAGSGYRMEIYGREGTLVVTGEDSPQLGPLFLHGARGGNKLAPLPIPPRLAAAADALSAAEAVNVSRLYASFAQTIRGGGGDGGAAPAPDFATAVALHRVIDAIQQASASGRAVTIP